MTVTQQMIHPLYNVFLSLYKVYPLDPFPLPLFPHLDSLAKPAVIHSLAPVVIAHESHESPQLATAFIKSLPRCSFLHRLP